MHPTSTEDKSSYSSHQFHSKVREAFGQQKKRGQKTLNGSLSDSDLEKYCVLNEEGQKIIDQAIGRFSLSFRAVSRVLKVARTIADITGEEYIQKEHLMEALSYRKR